jgi:hypothetical protein
MFWVEVIKQIPPLAIAGGLWGLYFYVRGRTFQKKLSLKVTAKSEPLGGNRFVFVEVELTNLGKGKLEARRVRPDDYVYKDEIEQLKYSCSLQIKRVKANALTDETFIDWYKTEALEPVPNIPTEIDLLDDYRVPAEEWQTRFWLEPGDTAHLSAPLILSAGQYLLKVSFYGTNAAKDFWSRLLFVNAI